MSSSPILTENEAWSGEITISFKRDTLAEINSI